MRGGCHESRSAKSIRYGSEPSGGWQETSHRTARNHPDRRRSRWRDAAVYSVDVMASSRLRVAETFRSIFYAPLAVAVHGGHFAAEGLEVDVVTAEFGAGTVGMRQRGEARSEERRVGIGCRAAASTV